MISLQFLGGAGTVTGSKYALTVGPHRIFIDGGLFQGRRELRERNWQPPPVRPADFEAMLLTHAHIDHSGYIPRLVKDGFHGPIFCTSATRELTQLLLRDCARLQQEEADYRNENRLTRHSPALPLYDEQDVAATVPLLQEVRYGRKIQVVPGIQATFHEAGHILGSAWLELDLTENGEFLKLVMSGDLGRENAAILRDPEPPVDCDYLVLESTYGDRLHDPEPVGPRLASVVREAIARQGVLVIPAFAVERAQELIYILGELAAQQQITQVPIFLDSPMAAEASHIFERHRECFDHEAKELARFAGGLLTYRKLKICASPAQSRQIFNTPPPYVVISASGMAEGGRVLHHLRRSLPNPRDTVLLVGFQAEETRGWQLQNGAPSLRIFGEDVPVRAQVEFLDGFSGHADYAQIARWLKHLTRPPRKVLLVHGEPPALQAQQARIHSWQGWSAQIPEPNQTILLN
ncbi:MAG: MBL fold metallo-hydrolase [Candidatus Eremiobacteraeota bacterium]|nr:MBL fold metallo-hydrolase [Candidatus Eremiobacteraeota bacterium]